MKRILIHIVAATLFAGCANQQEQAEPSVPASLPDAPWANTMTHSDFVFVCKVLDEGPLGHGANSVQKSYMVSYPESLYFGLVGLDLPSEIWIHYDSSRYPKVSKSGFESTFHKGDSFIAFLDYVNKAEFGSNARRQRPYFWQG